MPYFYAFLADVVVAVHLVYVGGAILGQLLILVGILARWEWVRNVWLRTLHLLAIVFVAFEAFIGMKCPLTVWENQLREAAGQRTDADVSFIGRLLDSVLFYNDTPEQVLTAGYYGFAILVVATFLFYPPRFRRRPTEPVPATKEVVSPRS